MNTDRTNHIADLPINKPTNNSQLLLKTVVLTEDFESVTAPALPTGWTTYNVGTPTDGVFETGDDAAANAGGYWPVPAHTNFAMVNDDVCNCDMNEVYLQLPDVDLTGLSNIALSYESFDDGQYGGNPHEVEVSINGGTTWTNIHTHTHNTTNWTTVTVMLGASTDNQAQVSIRIKYSDAGGWATGVAFDDVAVATLQNNNLALTSGVFQSLGLPYYMVPTTQVTAIDLFGTVDNIGVLDQPNTVLSCDVDGATFGTSAPVTVAAGTVGDTLVIAAQYTPAATVGTHSFDFSVASDSVDADPANNTIAAGSMEVTNYIYARDSGYVTGGLYNGGNFYEIGNVFQIFNTQYLHSIDVEIHSATAIGAVVYPKVLLYDSVLFNNIILSAGWDYAVTSSDLGQTVTLPLYNPVQLTSGNSYLALVGAYGDGGSTNDLVVAASGTSKPYTTYLFDPIMYYLETTPMVRMNFDCPYGPASVNINETVCNGPYTLNGVNYTTSGTYTQTLNTTGCDTIVNLNLIINNSTLSSITQTACDYYISPSGNTYNSTGIYYDTIMNSVWCDSIITIDLTVNYSSSHTINDIACGSYTINGQTFYSTGIYTQVLTNSVGCDSIITLNLTINPIQFNPDFSVDNQLFTSPPFAPFFTNLTPIMSNYDFTWDWGDGTTNQSNNVNVFHEYFFNGLYTVKLIAEDINTGCTDTLIEQDYIYCTGGLNGIDEHGYYIFLYPNPTSDHVMIEVESFPSQLVLMDIQGKVIREELITNKTHLMDISALDKGIYFVRIGEFSSKLIVE